MKMDCSRRIVLLVLLLCIGNSEGQGSKVLPAFSSIQDNLQVSSDLVTQDLFEKYSEIDATDFWHPHSLTSSTSSREIVQVQNIEKQWIPGKYLQWKYSRVGFHHYIIGITVRSIDVFDSNLKKVTSIDSIHPLVSLTVFSHWNFEEACPEVVIPVATSKGIEIYKLENDVISKVNDGWPLNYDIKAVEYCHVGVSTKLVVIPAEAKVPVSIYNVAINSTSQIWYHQRLPVTTGRCYVSVYELGSESYIAVASDVTLTIYNYDNRKGRYAEQQNISLSYPSQQLVSFSVAYKHYLASVPAIKTATVEFFGFNGHQYARDISIASIQATELRGLNVEDYRDEHFVLSKERSDGQIQILSYDGHSFTPDKYHCPMDICSTTAALENGAGFTINDLSYYVLPTSERSSQAEVLVISKYTQESTSPTFKQSSDLISQLKALLQRYKRWEGLVSSAKEILSDALSRTTSNDITGHWAIDNLKVKALHVNGNKIPEGNPFNDFFFMKVKWGNADFMVKLSDVDDILRQVRNLNEEAKIILKDSISITSDQVEVVSATQRVTGSFTAKSLTVDNLNVVSINNENDLDAFLASFVLYQNSLRLESSGVRFRGKIDIENLYTTKLNGILVKDIAHLRKSNYFQSDLDLKNVLVQGDVKVSRVNGVRFAEDIIRATDVSGVRFIDGIVSSKGASLKEPVDSVHINKEAFQNLLLRTTSQSTSVPYKFSEIFAQGSVKVTTINGIDFATLIRSIVNQDYTGLIRGEKFFKGSLSAESLFIQSTLNNFAFPQDLVPTTQKRLQISGKKTFSQLTATKVTVDGLIDRINTNDILSRLDHEIIRGKWILSEGAVFLNDLSIKGYVDGIKMEALKHSDTLDHYKSSYYPNADVEFLQGVTFRNLKVHESINDKTFDEVFGALLSFDSREVKVGGTTTFEQSISAQDAYVTSGTVNDIPLTNFFSLTLPQNVTGHKTFDGNVGFTSFYSLSTFDTVNLKALVEDAFRLSKPRTVSAKLSFEEIHCSNLKVAGVVNGVKDFAESVAVIKGRKEQVFKNAVEIDDLTTGSLDVLENLDVKAGRTIDGLEFNAWNSRRVSLSKEFRTFNPIEFTGQVVVKESCDIKKLNDILLSYLANRVLRTDREEQTFTKKFITSAPIRIENGVVRFEQEVSGYDLNRVFETAVPLRGENEVKVTGNWKFQSMHIVSELIVEGTTCGVDLAKLDADSLRSGESNVYISGENTFLSKIDVKEDLYVDKVNGDDLLSYVFTLNTEQTVKGRLRFEKDVYLEGELVSNGFINSVSLPWLSSIYACENKTTHVLKMDVDGNALLESNSLTVLNLIQGTDLNKFLNSVVKTDDKALRITGHKTFTQPIRIEGNMSVETVNEYPIGKLKNLFRKTESIQFTFPVTFGKPVEARSFEVIGDVSYHGLVGGYNLTELVIEAAYLNSRESLGTMSFDSSVVEGNIDDVKFLNGVALENVIRLDKPQWLGKLNVKDVIFGGSNVEVGGLICGYNISEEFQHTLFRNYRHQFVKGALTFDGNVIVNGNLQCLNDLRDDLVMLDEGVHIESPLIFSKTVNVETSLEVRGKINGQTLTDLETNYLMNGRPETISGRWTFAGGVTFKGQVTGNDQLDGFHIGDLIKEKEAEALSAEGNLVAERKEFDERCHLLDVLYRRVAHSPVKLEFFEAHQPSILMKQAIQEMTFIQAGNVSRLLTASGACALESLEFDTTTELFKSIQAVPRLGDVRQLETATTGNSGILVARTVLSTCSSVEGVSFVTLDDYGVYSSKEVVYSGHCAQISVTQYSDGMKWRPALFILGSDHISVQLYLWDIIQRKFIPNSKVGLGDVISGPGITDIKVIRLKAIPFVNSVGLFYQTQTSVHFRLFTDVNGAEESTLSLPFVGKSIVDSSSELIQVIQILSKTFSFLEDRDSFMPSECTIQVFEISAKGISLFQRLRIPAILAMETFSFGNQHFVVFLTKDAGLEIYQYKGLSGFEPISSSPIRIPGAIGIRAFTLPLWNHRLPQPFIAVTTPSSLLFLHSILNGDAVVYNQKLTEDLCLIDSSY